MQAPVRHASFFPQVMPRSFHLAGSQRLGWVRVMENSERQKTHNLLAPVYDWFTEGFDTADRKDAKALLDELK